MAQRQSMMNKHRPKFASQYANRLKRETSNIARPVSRDSQNAQRSYERYLALAQAQAQSGDVIGAENYYQHADISDRCPRTEKRPSSAFPWFESYQAASDGTGDLFVEFLVCV